MLRNAKLLMIVVVLGCTAGCASRCANRAPAACANSSYCLNHCHQTERLPLVPDVSAVNPLDSAPVDLPNTLCALAERSAQCLAATNAALANLLDHEADAISSGPFRLCGHGARSPLIAELLRVEAADRRNTAAADSLTAFYRLVEAEAGADNLARRGAELDHMLAEVGQLRERGMLSPVSQAEVTGQRLELAHRQAEVQATIAQLNAKLEQLLGLPLAPGNRFWPVVSLLVDAAPPDPQAEVGIALANRADLAALRLAANAEGSEATSAARTILQLSGTGLGGAAAGHCCTVLHVLRAAGECEAREQQVADLQGQRQRAAAAETRLAATLVTTRLVQIGLTRRRLEVAHEHRTATEQQHQMTEGASFKVRQARLDELAVEQDLLHDVVEWKLAVVQLKQAEGLLAIECGFDAALCVPAGCCQ